MPQCRSLMSKMLWSIVSNDLDRSKKMEIGMSFLCNV